VSEHQSFREIRVAVLRVGDGLRCGDQEMERRKYSSAGRRETLRIFKRFPGFGAEEAEESIFRS
jgi:hypothetical protein